MAEAKALARRHLLKGLLGAIPACAAAGIMAQPGVTAGSEKLFAAARGKKGATRGVDSRDAAHPGQ